MLMDKFIFQWEALLIHAGFEQDRLSRVHTVIQQIIERIQKIIVTCPSVNELQPVQIYASSS